MTKYTSIEDSKEVVKTEFYKCLGDDLIAFSASGKPSNYDYVQYIGSDKDYGDVFKVWNEDNEGSFTIYFGKKGDEFK